MFKEVKEGIENMKKGQVTIKNVQYLEMNQIVVYKWKLM